MRTEPGLAVVDPWIVPRRDNLNFAAEPPDFKVTGFLYEDRTFEPFRATITDPQTGSSRRPSCAVSVATFQLGRLRVCRSEPHGSRGRVRRVPENVPHEGHRVL
jgi:hypothetical protein